MRMTFEDAAAALKLITPLLRYGNKTVRLSVVDGVAAMTTKDDDAMITLTVGNGVEDGVAQGDASRLLKALAGAKGNAAIAAADGSITVELVKGRAANLNEAPDDWKQCPEPPVFESQASFVMPFTWLRTMGRIAESASDNLTRPILRHLSFECEGDRLRTVASDGSQLGWADVVPARSAGQLPAASEGWSMPAPVATWLAKHATGDVTVAFGKTTSGRGERLVQMRSGCVTVHAWPIEPDSYPRYRGLIPSSPPVRVVKLDRVETLDAISWLRKQPIDREPVAVESNGQVALTVARADVGRWKTDLANAAVQGESDDLMRHGYAPQRLECSLKMFDGATASLRLYDSDGRKPSLLVPDDDDGDQVHMLVMPVRFP